ncbi:hypothetical protein PAXINDRAFT_20383 [Paxillus involutus ATCC 200175]|uniref:Uncharacterized protein n=1 Tax=Paxillus involutus ATCC 200175 TaxID=664439 RepID=A0A0C9T4X9_PAXIN|nr:hypothetical protein PAXINDRAFT_20383 [Paxillus involutus ATCC 200175]
MAPPMIGQGFLFFFRMFGLGSGTRKPSRRPHTGCGSKSVWDCVCPRHLIHEYAITFDDEATFLNDSEWNIHKTSSGRFTGATSDFLQFGLSPEACKSYFSFDLFAGTTIIVCAERKGTPNRLTPSAKHQSAVMFLVRIRELYGAHSES